MAFRPKPIDVRSAPEQIAQQIRDAISDGVYGPGERLPTETELAESFQVSRGTIREALRMLSANKLVESTRGATGGTFVALPEPEAIAAQIGDTISLWFRAGNVSLAEVDHARSVVERECVRLAALNRTEDDLAAIRKAVEESRNPDLDLDEWLATDLDFHIALSRAAKNAILELAMTAIHMVRPRTNTTLIEVLERPPVSAQHWAIYEAVRDQDPDRASAAFEAHFSHLSDVQREALDRDADKITIQDIPTEDHPPRDVLAQRHRSP